MYMYELTQTHPNNTVEKNTVTENKFLQPVIVSSEAKLPELPSHRCELSCDCLLGRQRGRGSK